MTENKTRLVEMGNGSDNQCIKMTSDGKVTETITDKDGKIIMSEKMKNIQAEQHTTSKRKSTGKGSSDASAKYHIHASASQQQQTEGLSKLMDIMASCIELNPNYPHKKDLKR